MAKAILELEMPMSCAECPCGEYIGFRNYKCGALKKYCPKEGRLPDCPLKLADEHCRNTEWINGKCRGRRISPYTYEVLVQCKNCKDFEEYKEA
jgi:hypothetical protein